MPENKDLELTRAYFRAYYAANRERLNAYQKERRKKNRKEILEKEKKRREKNKDRIHQAYCNYIQKHGQELRKRVHEDRKKNPEKYRDRQRRYYKKHREKLLENARNSHRENPEKNRQKGIDYRAKNPNKRRQYYAKHRDRLCAYTRAYLRDHPEANSAKHERRRSLKNAVSINDLSASQWKEIQETYDYRCVYCDKRRKGKLTQDHIQPLSKGGNHTASNVVPACRSCNSRKHTGPPLIPVQPLLLTLAPPAKPRAKQA